MFTGDDRSSSSSCTSGELKRSHSQLENASIPEANENVIGEEVLSTLLSSILREKRQALLRQPEVAALLEQRRLGQFLVENQRN